MIDSYKLILILLFGLDIFFTLFNIYKYKKLFPNKDFTKLEANPIILWIWKKLGFKNGVKVNILIYIIFSLIVYFYFNTETVLIAIGIYILLTFYHLNNYNELKKIEKERKGKKDNSKIRLIFFSILIFLSILDLGSTYFYINNYHQWRADVPFNQMEQNPLILFFINLFGLDIGFIISTVIIFGLFYLIAFKVEGITGYVIIIILILALILNLYLNIINIQTLNQLIIKYPLGHI